MDRIKITLYREGGLAEWQCHPDLASAMDWYAWELVHGEHLPLSALIRELCEGCGEWYDLGSHKCGAPLDLAANGLRVVAGCEYAGRYGVHCEGLPAPANWKTGHGDSPDWSRTLCPAHAHAFGWEQANARHA
jgi:hypothetical protein